MEKFLSNNFRFAAGLLLSAALLTLPHAALADDEADLAAQEAALMAELKRGLNNPPQALTTSKKTEPNEASDAAEPEPAGLAAPAVLKKEIEEPVNKTAIQAKKSDGNSGKASLIIKGEQKKSTVSSAPTSPAASNASSNRVSGLEAALRDSEARNEQLMTRLKQQRNDLLLAEAEVARLSRLLEKQRHAALKSATGYSVAPVTQTTDARIAAVSPLQAEKMTPDMTIATVTVEKANLRTGPGLNNSPLMSVSKGTRLAVETRKGEWYRVVAPTGARAWVSAEVVHFGTNRLSEPTRTVRVQGYTDNAEENAFKLIRQVSR